MTTGFARLTAALLGVALLCVPPLVEADQPVPPPVAEEDLGRPHATPAELGGR